MSWEGESRALVKILGPGKERVAMEVAQMEIWSRWEWRSVVMLIDLFPRLGLGRVGLGSSVAAVMVVVLVG